MTHDKGWRGWPWFSLLNMYHHVGLMGRETTPSLSDSLDDTIFTGMEAGKQRGGEGGGILSSVVFRTPRQTGPSPGKS